MVAIQSFQCLADRVGIVAKNQTDYVQTMFACLEAGNVAVPLRSATDRDRINAAGVKQIITPGAGNPWFAGTFHPSETEAIALISFTSGTEGAPKGVMLTHQNLANVVARLNQVMQVDDSIREYVGVPVYHSFGFGRCRAVATAGGQIFIPSNGFNPAEIGELLRKGEINAISSVPSLWRVLLTNQDLIGQSGQRVRWIEIGSQYMSWQEKAQMKRLFPNARIVQHYGLTEASRTTLLEIHQTEGRQLESVGRSLGGVTVKLTPDGRIAIRGEHVAQAYLIEGEQVPLQDDEGWFETKDLGSLEDDYLYYQGRADDVINCGGIKVHPEALESKIYACIGRSNGLAVCRKPDPIRGEGFLVAVTGAIDLDRQELRKVVLQSTQELGVNAANAVTILDVDSLPQTATGKIQRRKLAEWYDSQTVEVAEPLSPEGDDSSPLRLALCRMLSLRQIQPDDTFISLGGDSLSYVEFSMVLERHLGYLPQGWENLRLSELEQLVPERRRYTTIEASMVFRALAIVEVVANHAGLIPAGYVGGGVDLLFLITGLNFARFQGESLLQGQFLQPILSLLRNLLIPYFAISLVYQVYRRELDLTVLLLISNFFNPVVSSIFPIWFVQVLTQCMVLFCLPFTVRSVRDYARVAPWKFGLMFLAIAVSACIVGLQLWDTNHLYNRVPHALFWIFVLGWCIHFAQSTAKKMATTAILLLLILVVLRSDITPHTIWTMGGVVLLWVQFVPVPQILKLPIQTVSAAAYYIYLTHIIFIHLLTRGVGVQSPLIVSAIAILGGALSWMAVQKIQQVVVGTRLKTHF